MSEDWRLDPVLRFDVYVAVRWRGRLGATRMQFAKMGNNLPHLGALLLAGVDEIDFNESLEHTGWCGTCPAYLDHRPVVIVMHGETVTKELYNFMDEAYKR